MNDGVHNDGLCSGNISECFNLGHVCCIHWFCSILSQNWWLSHSTTVLQSCSAPMLL